MIRKTLALCMLTMLALTCGGCESWFCGKKPIKYNVTVSIDEDMRQSLGGRKLEVHLVGINETQHARWENYPMSKYWVTGDTLMDSVPTKKMVFDPDNLKPQTLTVKDKLWDGWLKDGANRLYVLTLLPGMVDDAPGDKDPRRQILPLACYRWLKRDRNIEIKVQRSAITNMSQLRQEH